MSNTPISPTTPHPSCRTKLPQLLANTRNQNNYQISSQQPQQQQPRNLFNKPATNTTAIKQRMDPEGANILFVSHLPRTPEFTKDVLYTAFQQWGTVIHVDLIKEEAFVTLDNNRSAPPHNNNNNNNQPTKVITKCYAFVSMETEQQCDKVIRATVQNKIVLPAISPHDPVTVDYYHNNGMTGFEDISVMDNNGIAMGGNNLFQQGGGAIGGGGNRMVTDFQRLTKFDWF